jgi:hypothetical protein
MLAAGAVVVIFLIGFLYFDAGWQTAPVQRTDDQNSGSDAPSEVLPPADAPAQSNP